MCSYNGKLQWYDWFRDTEAQKLSRLDLPFPISPSLFLIAVNQLWFSQPKSSFLSAKSQGYTKLALTGSCTICKPITEVVTFGLNGIPILEPIPSKPCGVELREISGHCLPLDGEWTQSYVPSPQEIPSKKYCLLLKTIIMFHYTFWTFFCIWGTFYFMNPSSHPYSKVRNSLFQSPDDPGNIQALPMTCIIENLHVEVSNLRSQAPPRNHQKEASKKENGEIWF